MERRNVPGRVVSFVIGAAGIVLVTFVVFPWLQGRGEPAHQPVPRDAASEEAFASFGEEGAGAGGKTERQLLEGKDVMIVPSQLLPGADANPGPGPRLETPPISGPQELGTGPAPGVGRQHSLSPEEQEAVVSEPTRMATVSVAEVGDGQASVDRLPEEAEAVEEPSSAETVQSVTDESFATAVKGVVDVGKSTPAEPALAEGERDAEPLQVETFRETNPAWQSSRAGLRRLEFEMPDNLRFVKPTGGAGDMSEGAEPTVPVAPLSEFSPRQFSRSVLPATEVRERSDRFAEADDARQAQPLPVPGTLRGVMGYRLPLISRQELPDQVVSGVLIPAHTTYVILKPGYWELVELSPDEARAMRAAADKATAGELSADSEPVARSWNPLRLFRKKRPQLDGN